ncbi:MAG: hypothetical protein HXY39_08425 [Chloroflexi bacterium]|nr:hypothetical protein [Chloroflexota bacterium]
MATHSIITLFSAETHPMLQLFSQFGRYTHGKRNDGSGGRRSERVSVQPDTSAALLFLSFPHRLSQGSRFPLFLTPVHPSSGSAGLASRQGDGTGACSSH